MRIRPLPEIDLARITPLPSDQQRRHLMQIRFGRPPLSYGPVRACLHDIFNVEPALFGPVAPTEWRVIRSILERKCSSPEELAANTQVAKGLHQFVTATEITGRAQAFDPMGMGVGQRVVYWLSMVLVIGDQLIVPFIDPRRSRYLTREGRKFVFSMMHERIRAVYPDYAAVQFGIFQFGDKENNIRHPILHTDSGVELFSFTEMEAMVATTYTIWREVCGESELEIRRKAGGVHGSLL